jgi:hypothetical protein
MTYENFLSIILKLKKQGRQVSNLYKQKIDLIEFTDPYNTIIAALFTEIYGEEGWDWISWFCYDNEYGEKGLQAWDENKEPICHSFLTLWEHLEKNHKKHG